ncbi:ABC transporter substrate-binding protein [Rubrivivax gelatinosus]|uniref:Amino acid/amide ABC transporter substrate-binding protein (HAAT family) n=1 Tax=Rubrivivax gelatinosus TaxID=28068 RepID=A0A4R2MQ43_RUBGE|nr:ABC transporter substrate-binding protein [Rubrivivax gelatinosus]MBK1686728.1 ABC transporter permease [Rubrivivax gelatinosus]TCP05246.1 amino acid/amide ABC transporter substrate-binding protein (HAAT family) [Rubrivivax gelatinosus]
MKLASYTLAAAALVAATGAFAQAKEQFFPLLVYRTGPYAPNGTPWANGKQDYLKMINARDGGVNGVKLSFEECETGYATDKGVECYERLKGKGASLFDPQATGITFALTDKAPADKVPLLTLGYGLSSSADGGVFKWNFPLMGSYWTAADILIQHLGKKEGGLDKLKGKKIALVYHDSPFGKEPIPLLDERQKMHGFDLVKIPVTAPGVEQKSAWLQVRQQRPDYVLLWGWGVMNSTALKEAQATGFPREKMYGVWWAGAEPDVKDVGMGAKGYNALALNTSGTTPQVIQDILKHVHDKGQGTGPKDEVGSVLYTRGVIIQALGVEAVRRAQERFGKGKVMTGEQVRWGLENLALDDKKLAQLGLTGVIRPISTSCMDHQGSTWARVQTWDGAKWGFSSDWYQADEQILKPMIKSAADRYAGEKKLTRRSPADCQS